MLAFPVCVGAAPEFLKNGPSFRIISIGGILVCSACGYENQVGNRFCGMCGTPLPHRPLTIPGAQGTHSFMRVPLESAMPPEREPATTPPEETSAPAPPSRPGVLLEMPSPESRSTQTTQSENSVPAPDIIPEVPLEEYVKSFHYAPPADPKEITMRGDAPVLQPEVAVTGAPATAPTERVAAGAASFAPADDVRERLGLGESPQDERGDRPRFLDFSEPPPPPEKPAAGESNIVRPSFLGLSDAPRVSAEPAAKTETGKPARGRWGIWFAVAVLLIFGVLGVLEWLSRVNQTNDGPLEVITMKIRDITHSNNQAPQPATETNPSKPEMQAEVQPKPQEQDQNAAANPSVPTSTSVNSTPAAPDANAGANAAKPPQKTTAATGDQPRGGQEVAKPTPSSSVNGAQKATGQKATQPRPTPPTNTPKSATANETEDAAPNPAEKPKPKPRAAQEGDEEAPVEKIVPGEEEMAKANNASDSAAAAAWLWKATAKGNPDAPVRLAGMYIKGDGVPRNCEQALVLLKTAAAKENTRASNRLGSMYASGTCVQRNRVEAYRWLSSSLVADPNNRSARQNRDLLWQQMTPDERAEAEKYR